MSFHARKLMGAGGEAPPEPSYANEGGTGNRASLITVTTDATQGGGALSNLIDGNIGSDSSIAWWWQNLQSGRELRFAFLDPKAIDQFKWYQDVATTHGDWKMQGSNNGSLWVDLSSNFTLGGVAQVVDLDLYNGTRYTQYRLLQMSGVTSHSPWLQEIEFRID